ncbi:MAG: RsmD family RNA methyltransferase, partial [Spirochaetia bacterium]|nr:RsmD family RNA methyltransferase [Spirochaetia bacterium]
LRKNISFVDSEIRLYMMSVQSFMRKAVLKGGYDVVYADPPFPMPGKQKIIDLVDASGAAADDGIFVIHYPAEEKLADRSAAGGLECYDERKYGRSLLRFYRKTDNERQ